MATSLRCPECAVLLRLAATLVTGQKITCPKCGSAFSPSTSENDNQSSSRNSKSSRVEDREDKEETPRPRKSAPKSQSQDDEANGKKPRKSPKKKKQKKKNNSLMFGLAGGGVFLLLLCGLIIWLVAGRKPSTPQEADSTPPPTDTNSAPSQNGKTPEQKTPPKSDLQTSANSPTTTNTDPSKESTEKTQRATVFIQGPSGAASSTGSGFIVKSTGDTAYIITNFHIVQPGAEPPAEGGTRQVKPPAKPANPPANPNHPPPKPPTPKPPPPHHGIGTHLTLPTTGTPSLPPMVKPNLTVILYRGMPDEQSIFTNDVVAIDDEADLAVIRLAGVRNLPLAVEPTEDAATVETTPISIFGFPGGSKSIVVGKDSIAQVSRDQNNEISKLQINGELDHGNSGGPVIDTQGRLVGVATSTPLGKHVIPTAKVNQMFRGSIRNAFVAQWKQQGFVIELDGDSWLFDRKYKVHKHLLLKLPFGESAIKLNYPSHQFLVFARVIDPMHKINNVNIFYSLAPPNSVSQGSQGWAPLPNAQKLPLKFDDQRFLADIQLPSGAIPNQLYTFQFSFVNEGATIYTEPYSIRLNVPKN
jgi:S1-C subfamily serine protease